MSKGGDALMRIVFFFFFWIRMRIVLGLEQSISSLAHRLLVFFQVKYTTHHKMRKFLAIVMGIIKPVLALSR